MEGESIREWPKVISASLKQTTFSASFGYFLLTSGNIFHSNKHRKTKKTFC